MQINLALHQDLKKKRIKKKAGVGYLRSKEFIATSCSDVKYFLFGWSKHAQLPYNPNEQTQFQARASLVQRMAREDTTPQLLFLYLVALCTVISFYSTP